MSSGLASMDLPGVQRNVAPGIPRKSNTSSVGLTISTVTPTYNSSAGLSRLLSSIKDQDYPQDAIEMIVVDGGSTDGTIKVAESNGAKVIIERSGRPEMAT